MMNMYASRSRVLVFKIGVGDSTIYFSIVKVISHCDLFLLFFLLATLTTACALAGVSLFLRCEAVQ